MNFNKDINFVELAQRSPPNKVFILLHGLGDNMEGIFNLANFYAKYFPDSNFVALNATYNCPHVSGGFQWFEFNSWQEDIIFNKINESAIYLKNFIEYIKKIYEVKNSQIILLGFSQGCMMALHVALRMQEEILAVLGFSGMLVKPSVLTSTIKSRPAIYLSHGIHDSVVPYAQLRLAEQELKKHNLKKLEIFKDLEAEHNITMQSILKSIDFVKSL